MAQDTFSILPMNINADAAYENIQPNESPFIKNFEISLNSNPDIGIGTNNPVNEGQNDFVLTPKRSNAAIYDGDMPPGFNKTIGSFESIITQELYQFNYNDNGNHGIYVLDGNTGIWSKVVVDPVLEFSDSPEAFIAEHRVRIRIRKDQNNNVIEKYLLITDGKSYHKWIDVIAAQKTDGFNASLFPYFQLQPPHFDKQELFAWAVRSPMIAPNCSLLPNTPAEKGKVNRILNTAFQFCYQDIFTDGRATPLTSPFSLPIIVKQNDFITNPDLIPKRIQLEMDGGSCKVEKRNIFVRRTIEKPGTSFGVSWGDWYLVDTINKFSNTGNNSPSVIGNDYWKRIGAWSNYSYNQNKNTIKYVYDGSKVELIEPNQDLFKRLGNEMPQLSVALSDLGNSLMLCNNRYGFDNFGDSVINKFSSSVNEKQLSNCQRPLREIKLYVYLGRERGNKGDSSSIRARNIWVSQIGYYNGTDTQMRFGGLYPDDGVKIDVDESKYFDLDFADKNGLRCYLKGTEYFADCEWYLCREDFSLQKITNKINAADNQDVSFLTNSLKNKGFFVGVFTFKVPAGRYVATLGRHNVASTGNYRDTSTYIVGIADSTRASTVSYTTKVRLYISFPPAVFPKVETVKTVKINDVVTNSKELEIDCTAGDVDVWGNGKDLFYVLVPFNGDSAGAADGGAWQFAEGYLYESENDKIGIEKFPYGFYKNGSYATGGERGIFTDKNGFFFAYTWGDAAEQTEQDIRFTVKKDCSYPQYFTVDLDSGRGWKRNIETYFDILNGGSVGNENRVLVEGYIKDLTNTIPYSNTAVTLVDGATVYTDSNGFFSLIAHNGLNNVRVNNIYINSSGNFTISYPNCGYIPLFNYTEPVCSIQVRRTPLLNININAETTDAESLKSGASYAIGVVGADIAGRVTYVNKFDVKDVLTFQQRNNINPTYFKWLLSGNLQLQNDIKTKDIKWISFFVLNTNIYKKYIQWVANSIEYVDSNGNVTTNTSSASLVKINISSLLQTNINSNFSVIANYQFAKNDKLRIIDNGDGQILNTTQFGDIIDVVIQGTNYNQAAVNANLVPASESTPLNTTTNTVNDPTTLYVKYDKRFDVLKDKTGFWIEIYTPSQNTDELPFYQSGSFYPIINGEIAEYVSGGANNPVYNFPTTGDIPYWDTYYLRRSISGIGQFIGHPFESPNITDTWGTNIISGGKVQTINNNAARLWYVDDTIKSDDYVDNSNINGLALFRFNNRKQFKGYQRGGIVAVSCQYSTVLFICENDWFVTDYNFNYIYANEQGVQVANLDNNLSVPHQKVGQNFGCKLEDTGTVLVFDEYVSWLDNKNQGYILCDYRSAVDVSDIVDENGKKYGIKSYLYEKLNFINNWNNSHPVSQRFDIVAGIDLARKNIYITFRPRRNNTNDLRSYVNRRRNWDLKHQETIVFNITKKRWVPCVGFTAESYGKIRGASTGLDFISYAAGKPYSHNSATNDFLSFYGILTEPVIMMVVNKDEDIVKILESISLDTNNSGMYSDLIYSTQVFGYSYIPGNLFKQKEKMYYAPFLRDMVSYLQDPVKNDFRSTLIDGKRLFGEYFVIRLIQNFNELGKYFELNKTFFLYTSSAPTKPPQT